MNIIFLDIDGVLNSYSGKNQIEKFGFDDRLVANLKYILDNVYNVKIVVSSSWRTLEYDETQSEDIPWREILSKKLGIDNYKDIFIGDTPYRLSDKDKCNRRGKEIHSWIEENKSKYRIDNFVIIDDTICDIVEMFPNNIVQTDNKIGLTIANAKAAIWILTNFGREKNKMNNTFIIGDCHFYHKNIIRYCNRPWNSGVDFNGNLVVTDDDVEQMNNALIENWNNVVSDNSIVYVNGDFCFGNIEKVKNIVSQLRGKKYIVLGNHDKHKIKDYYDAGFDKVYDKPILIYNFILLSHEPIQWIKDGDVYMNIYAHVHNQEMYKDFTSNTFCSSAERINYTPIKLSEIIKNCQSV